MGTEWTKLSPNANGEASQLNTYKILNLEEVLSEEEENLLEETLRDREKGKYHTFEEVFG
jgi:hypothetical protein